MFTRSCVSATATAGRWRLFHPQVPGAPNVTIEVPEFPLCMAARDRLATYARRRSLPPGSGRRPPPGGRRSRHGSRGPRRWWPSCGWRTSAAGRRDHASVMTEHCSFFHARAQPADGGVSSLPASRSVSTGRVGLTRSVERTVTCHHTGFSPCGVMRRYSSGYPFIHLLSYRDEDRGRVWDPLSVLQIFPNQRGSAWSASNTRKYTENP